MSRTVCGIVFLIAFIVGVRLLHADLSMAAGRNPVAAEQSPPLRDHEKSDPLDRPLALDHASSTRSTSAPQPQSPAVGLPMSTIVGGLAICLGIFLLIVVLTRRNTPNKFGP